VKKKAEIIRDDYTPSDNLIDWCKSMGISSHTIDKEKMAFIFWHKETKQKRSYFNVAFKNWLKKSLSFSKKDEDVIRKGGQSFCEYKTMGAPDTNRSIGRAALNKLLGKKDEKPE